MSAITDGRTPAQVSVDQIRGDLPVFDLVTLAERASSNRGDALLERYAPLVWPICHRHRLGGSDACSKALPDGRHRGQLRIPCERLMDTAWLGPQRSPEGTPK